MLYPEEEKFWELDGILLFCCLSNSNTFLGHPVYNLLCKYQNFTSSRRFVWISQKVFTLIFPHTFRMSLILFFFRENFSIEKLISTFLQLRDKLSTAKSDWEWYTDVCFSLKPDEAVEQPFVKNFWSSWKVHMTKERSLIGFFARKFRRPWNIWTSNVNWGTAIYWFHHTAHVPDHKFAGDRWKVCQW